MRVAHTQTEGGQTEGHIGFLDRGLNPWQWPPRLTHFPQVIPLARVKKICKLDPEVKSLSKEATALIGKAAEGFVQHLARQTLATASAKRTLRPSDIAHCVQHRADFAWLRADYPASEYAPEKKVAKRAALERPAKNATMTQFLKPAAPAVQEPDADDDEEEDE